MTKKSGSQAVSTGNPNICYYACFRNCILKDSDYKCAIMPIHVFEESEL